MPQMTGSHITAAMANRTAVGSIGQGQGVHTHASAASPPSHTWRTKSGVVAGPAPARGMQSRSELHSPPWSRPRRDGPAYFPVAFIWSATCRRLRASFSESARTSAQEYAKGRLAWPSASSPFTT